MNYVPRFNELVEKLRSFPDIQLLNYNTFGGVSDNKLKVAEEEIKYSLPDSVKSFYKETNGLQLRWIHKSHPSFTVDNYKISRRHSEWESCDQKYFPLSGSIMIMPVEKVFLTHDAQLIPYNDYAEKEREAALFKNVSYGLEDYLENKTRPFDLFGGKFTAAALVLSPEENFPVVLNWVENDNYLNSRVTDFGSYLEMLIANYGSVHVRDKIYKENQGLSKSALVTPCEYWTSEKISDPNKKYDPLDFPLSDTEGHPKTKMDNELMTLLAKEGPQVTQEEWIEIERKHQLFLKSGGSGGSWQFFEVAGITLTLYTGVSAREGEQITMTDKRLDLLDLTGIKVPYSNFCRAISPGISYKNSDLSNSACTDTDFENCDFSGSNLKKADFSRSNMRNCNFQNADLSGADFENCDLSGSDFTGANLSASKFPGAILENVKK